MKIKGKVQFTVGIADVLLSIAVSVLAVIQHQEYKLIGAVFVLLCGIIALTNGIETKKQQKKKGREIQTDDGVFVWRGR